MTLFDANENGMTAENLVDSEAYEQSCIPRTAVGGPLKRVFDIVFASVVLLLILPLFIIVALMLKITDPGPVICKNVRVGLSGRRFTCFKFRTIVVDLENVLNASPNDHPGAASEWERS